MNTLAGRLEYNWSLCNPIGLRWGQTAVDAATATISKHQRGESVSLIELKHAQTVMAVSAPQGSLSPAPCRPSGWALATVPVMAFIVTNAVTNPTSLPHIIAGQWLNQTQNAVITWYNRPK